MRNMVNCSYISKITLNGFCDNQKLEWSINAGVNVLSGVNGSGKSTLIEALALLFRTDVAHNTKTKPYDSIVVEFTDGTIVDSSTSRGRKVDNVDVIATFDTPLKAAEAVKRLSGDDIYTDLDWELYKTLSSYLKYQLAVGNRAIKLLLKGKDNNNIELLMSGKKIYFDMIDAMFEYSGKKIVRDSDELVFATRSTTITPYHLSSGEKQLLIILTTVLIQDNAPSILIMDEPELSLHHDWQRALLANIMTLNSNVQVISTTHSPAMIMDGWLDRVTDIGDITDMK